MAAHSRVRGAHLNISVATSPCAGPSPRAWGSRGGHAASAGHRRSIPTCVGLTTGCAARCPTRPVHPHVRGAHDALYAGVAVRTGPSPRAWGSHPLYRSGESELRSIPTCVGLTHTRRPERSTTTVHPHVRGAHLFSLFEEHSPAGPSPRAWGSQGRRPGVHDQARSIPTCVGLTEQGPGTRQGSAVHPHVRGAHMGAVNPISSSPGPSPRAWGSQTNDKAKVVIPRSIPTCVGLTGGVGHGGLLLRSIPTCVGLTRKP